MGENKPWMNRLETIEFLGITQHKFRALRKAGMLKAIQEYPGGRRFYEIGMLTRLKQELKGLPQTMEVGK